MPTACPASTRSSRVTKHESASRHVLLSVHHPTQRCHHRLWNVVCNRFASPNGRNVETFHEQDKHSDTGTHCSRLAYQNGPWACAQCYCSRMKTTNGSNTSSVSVSNGARRWLCDSIWPEYSLSRGIATRALYNPLRQRCGPSASGLRDAGQRHVCLKNISGGWVRTTDLWVMSPARSPLRHTAF